MKKIVPFKKDIFFKTEVYEITSISLEHDLMKENNIIKGNFNINGDYKMTETSIAEPFSFDLPVTIEMDSKYNLENISLDIDDFYYELNNNALNVNIDVLIDNIIENEVERCIEEETSEKINEVNTNDYNSYTVYIVRDGDTLETIIEKYRVEKDILLEYNDLTEIKIGDKIIIPC